MTPMRLIVLLGLLIVGGCESSTPNDNDPPRNTAGSSDDGTPDDPVDNPTDDPDPTDDPTDDTTGGSGADCPGLPREVVSDIGPESTMWIIAFPDGSTGGIYWGLIGSGYTGRVYEGDRTPDDIVSMLDEVEETSGGFFEEYLADRCEDQLGADGVGTCDVLVALEIDGCRGLVADGQDQPIMPSDAELTITWATPHSSQD